jgi:hypothetical protein
MYPLQTPAASLVPSLEEAMLYQFRDPADVCAAQLTPESAEV